MNVAIFSSMDAVILRPLAVPAMDHVMVLAEQQQQRRDDSSEVALANFEDWFRQSRSFESLSVFQLTDFTLTGAGDAARVRAGVISEGFFPVLRAQPLLGRLFDAAEFEPGRDEVAVLSYRFWQGNFGSNPNVIGQKVLLDQREYTVVGVLPKAMQYPPEADIFLPFAPTPAQLANRSRHSNRVLGRLRDGATLRQAQSEMEVIANRLANAYPATNQGWTVRVEPLLQNINGDLTPLYYKLIMGATLFVLLVVCANVANLQLARGVSRRPEIAMRTALGAGRRRIIRQLLTENILLALFGAAGGIAIAAVYLHITIITMPARVCTLHSRLVQHVDRSPRPRILNRDRSRRRDRFRPGDGIRRSAHPAGGSASCRGATIHRKRPHSTAQCLRRGPDIACRGAGNRRGVDGKGHECNAAPGGQVFAGEDTYAPSRSAGEALRHSGKAGRFLRPCS